MADLIPRFRDPGYVPPPDKGTDTSLSTVDLLNQINRGAQGAANLARVPGAAGLEAQSSADIASLLNPPAMFPDINRQSAELGAARGVAGSPAALGTGLRMTEDERLRHIALGTQLLNAAYGRNPGAPLINPALFTITPLQRQELANQSLASLGRGGAPAYSPHFGGAGDAQRYVDLSSLLRTTQPPNYGGYGPSGGMASAADWSQFMMGGSNNIDPTTGGVFGGGYGPQQTFDLSSTLEELGLGDLSTLGSDVSVPGFDEGDLGFYE